MTTNNAGNLQVTLCPFDTERSHRLPADKSVKPLSTSMLVSALKTNGEDFEWYPTTPSMLSWLNWLKE